MVDVLIPAVVGGIFLVIGLLWLLLRERWVRSWIEAEEERPFRLTWLPIRWWPRRFDALVGVASGIVSILGALLFFAIAILAALD